MSSHSVKQSHVGRAIAAVLMAGVITAQHAGAQSLTPLRNEVTVAPAFQSWRFGKDVPLDSILVSGASQLSLPFSLQFPFRTRWMTFVSGAVASSRLDAHDSSGTVTRTFTGLTDIRLRANGKLIGDGLQVTLGLNIPTGTVNLSPAENDVVRVTAAPALDAQVPIAGTGFGGTIGLVAAREFGAWAWALGAGVEQRGTYAPLDAQIAGLKSRTELEPGSAMHVSLGADGLVGKNRLTIGVVTDLYGADKLRLTTEGSADRTAQYHLGPTTSAAVELQVENPRIRNLTFRVNERYRTGFRDDNDVNVEGSSGNYLELGISGLLGAPNRTSLLLGVGVQHHTGLPVDKAFIGAALTSFGATLGAAIPTSTLMFTPSARVTAGSLRTELVSTGMTGITIGLTVTRR